MRNLRVMSLIIGSLLVSSAVRAVDGEIEINQAIALAGGINGSRVSDPAGFPVTITESGSYVLTGNLVVPDENTTAIQVGSSASRTTIDLNGFAIRGAVACSPVTGQCSPKGAGVGIETASTTIGVRVQNGIVTGMGSHGIMLRSQAFVQGVQAISNGGHGIEVGARSSVVECQAIFNGRAGIRIADSTGSLSTVGESVLTDNLAIENAIEDSAAFDIIGSRATGGNVCSDGSCSARGARRFYLTSTFHNGSEALQACTDGYHMASMWEIHEVSNLEYVKTPRPGVSAFVNDDSGEGPPSSAGGWVRTGIDSAGFSQPGQSNCDAWLTGTNESFGSFARLLEVWDAGPTSFIFDYWHVHSQTCGFSLHVWCVEN